MSQAPRKGADPDGKAGKRSAGEIVTDIAVGQASFWVRRFIGLFFAAVAGVMLAISWVPFAPLFSAWHARLVATESADAEVIGHRYVCERAWADQLEQRGHYHVVGGEAGCRMRSEALLRFVDKAGATHEVAAPDPYDLMMFQGLTPGTAPNPFERIVPLVQPQFFVETEAMPKLEAVESRTTSLYSFMTSMTGDSGPFTQRNALELRIEDPLLFEALAWLGPPPATRVHLRYDPEEPERAWLAGLFDAPTSQRIPMTVGLVLVPVATWIAWHVAGLFTLGMRREIPIALAAIAVLATPFWAPRFYDLVEWFSEDGAIAASLREDFGEIGQRNDLRTEPLGGLELVRVAGNPVVREAHEAALAGLMPARPARSFATLGEAYAFLCEAAGARLANLEPMERELRWERLVQLRRIGTNGPMACLFPVALAEARAAHAQQQSMGSWLKNVMANVAYEHELGSSFAGDWERDKKWEAAAKAALTEEFRIAPEPES